MRILYFSKGYTPHDLRFMNAIIDSGHECWSLRLDAKDDLERRPLPKGVSLAKWPGEPSTEGFKAVVAQVRPGMVQAGPVQTCAKMVAEAGFHPLLTVSWGFDLLPGPLSGYRDEDAAWTLKRSDYFFCDNEAVKAKAAQLAQFPSEKVICFPWGVDLQEFKPQEKTKSDDAPVWISLRSWESIYGIDTLLDAFTHALKTLPKLKLILAGGGSLKKEIEARISKEKISHAVQIPGRLDESEIPSLLAQADFYISCSLTDGSSVSLLQAMAMGLPVVVTDIPGNRQWVKEGIHGWTAPVGNAEMIAKTIVKASSLGEKEKTLIAKANRTWMETYADWNKNRTQLTQLYKKIEANHGSS